VGGSFSWFAARRLVALALTVVLAPTIVWTVFNGLRGTGGLVVALRPGTIRARGIELGTAVVLPRRRTGWASFGIYREIRSVYSFADLPMIQAMVIETTVLIVVANTLADLIQARMDPRLR
jgi:hypothetical protein